MDFCRHSRFPFIALVALCGLIASSVSLQAQVRAAAYVIADQTTGYVLESANAEKKLPVASLTKIATAMVVLDWSDTKGADLSQVAVVPESANGLNSVSGLALRPGDRCSLRDLLYAALMQSDNSAAETLADHVGRALGTSDRLSPVAHFVAQMNALARRLGMERTRFLNAHGLDSLERAVPYSTAKDIARLTRYAMSHSAFRFYVSQRERKIRVITAPAGQPSEYLLRTTNELLGVNLIDGVKTGTTRKSGQCLVISAARAPESRQEGETHIITPRRLNVVVLNGPDRFAQANQLLSHGWQRYDAWAMAGRPMKSRRSK